MYHHDHGSKGILLEAPIEFGYKTSYQIEPSLILPFPVDVDYYKHDSFRLMTTN